MFFVICLPRSSFFLKYCFCFLFVHHLFTLFTIFSQFVYYLFTICSLFVHYLFTICSLFVHQLFNPVHNLFTICSPLFTICSPSLVVVCLGKFQGHSSLLISSSHLIFFSFFFLHLIFIFLFFFHLFFPFSSSSSSFPHYSSIPTLTVFAILSPTQALLNNSTIQLYKYTNV